MASNQINIFNNQDSANNSSLFARIINCKTSLFFAVFIPLILVIGGCRNRDDLVRIQNFTALARQANDEFPKVANDFYLSCLRAAQYQALLPKREVNPLVMRDEAEEKCDETPSQDFGARLIEANGVLIAYLQSLGKLASDDVINYNSDLEDLKGQLSKLPNINTSQVDGGINIAKILLRAATDGYRREELKKVILLTNDDLQTFNQGIAAIIKGAYIGVFLRNEESLLDGYYGDYISNILNHRTEGDTQTTTVLLLDLDNKWNEAKDTIQQKRALSQKYVDILFEIAQSHDALSKKFGAGKDPSEEEMRKMLDKNTKALESFVKKLRDVNSK